MNLVLEFDDFHFLDPENCLKTINKYVNIIPKIKISLFTVPMLRGIPLFMNQAWCYQVRNLIQQGSLEICRHGLNHDVLEFRNLSYEEAKKKLMIGDHIFEVAGLQTQKVFRAPFWGINENVVHALNDLNYTHLYNHRDYSYLDALFKAKVVRYNWNLSDPFDDSLRPEWGVIAHGHTHDVCGNGIEETFQRVIDVLKSRPFEFKFTSEVA